MGEEEGQRKECWVTGAGYFTTHTFPPQCGDQALVTNYQWYPGKSKKTQEYKIVHYSRTLDQQPMIPKKVRLLTCPHHTLGYFYSNDAKMISTNWQTTFIFFFSGLFTFPTQHIITISSLFCLSLVTNSSPFTFTSPYSLVTSNLSPTPVFTPGVTVCWAPHKSHQEQHKKGCHHYYWPILPTWGPFWG